MSLTRASRIGCCVLAAIVSAFLPAVAGTVGLSWTGSAGATGYHVHYGTASGNYTTTVDVGNTTSTVLQGLQDCTRYYFAVSAYNQAGESALSTEASSVARPVISNVAPPGAQQGQQLAVAFSGTNFDSGATVQFSGSGIQVTSVAVASCASLTAQISIGATAATGARSVTITNPGGAQGTAAGAFVVQAVVAPSVTATTPTDGATGVALDVHPTVTFSEPLLATSVSAATVRLLNAQGSPVAAVPTLSGSGSVATLVPAADLQHEATYRIQVIGGASGVLDLTGTPMASTYLMASGFQTVGDTDAPLITQVVDSQVGRTSARITWTTDEAADGQVFYRRSGEVAYQQTAIVAALSTQHDLLLQGLDPGTSYDYHVRSADAEGNAATSDPDGGFTTSASPYDYLRFETEHGALVAPVRTRQGALGFDGGWIDTPSGGTGSAGSPRGTATFGIHLPRSATWYVWVRLYGPATNQDAWFESMNGAARQAIAPSATGVWQWVEGRSYALSSGLNDFELGGFEAQARADRVLLTDDPDFVPTEAPGADTTPPGGVTGFSAVAADGRVDLAWTNPSDSDLDRVVVRYRTDGRYPLTPVDGLPLVDRAATSGASDGHAHTGLTNGTTYRYAVFALDEAANTAPGLQQAATPQAAQPPPPTPQGLTVN
jgi:hypothetical protein